MGKISNVQHTVNSILKPVPEGLLLDDKTQIWIALAVAGFGIFAGVVLFCLSILPELSRGNTQAVQDGFFITFIPILFFGIPASLIATFRSYCRFDCRKRRVTVHNPPFVHNGKTRVFDFSQIQGLAVYSEIRVKYRRSRRGITTTTRYLVWLVSLQLPGELINLHVCKDESLIRQLAETLAKKCQWSILDCSSDQEIIRDYRELDIPFYHREDYEPEVEGAPTKPTEQLHVQSDGSRGCTVEIRPGSIIGALITLFLCVLPVPTFLLYHIGWQILLTQQQGLADHSTVWMIVFALLMLVTVISVVFYLMHVFLNRRILYLSAQGVEYYSQFLGAQHHYTHLPLRKIEAIQIEKGLYRKKLAIKSDEEILSIDNLSEGDLKWLQQQTYLYLRG